MKKHTYQKLLIPAGLLFISCTLLNRHYFFIADFWNGFLIGIGLILEIAGMIVLKKLKNNQQ